MKLNATSTNIHHYCSRKLATLAHLSAASTLIAVGIFMLCSHNLTASSLTLFSNFMARHPKATYTVASLSIISGLAIGCLGIRSVAFRKKHTPLPQNVGHTFSFQSQDGIPLEDDEGLNNFCPQTSDASAHEKLRYPDYLSQQTGTNNQDVDLFISYDKSKEYAHIIITKADSSQIQINECPIYYQANTKPKKAFCAVPNALLDVTEKEKRWILYPLNRQTAK